MIKHAAELPAAGSEDLAGWLTYLESMLGAEFSMRPGLDRSARVWQRLNPLGLRIARQIVIVAGTNGKGSTAAGLSVGVYGSPHVLRFNERCRIDGEEVSNARFCQVFEQVETARHEAAVQGPVPLSYYEFTTLAVFELLRAADLDLVVLEVGLGGRLDTVNLIDADLAIITRIGLDHQAVLGNTLELIGAEKAGILRQDGLCVLGSEAMPASVLTHAAALNNVVRGYGEHFDERHYGLADAGLEHHGTCLPAVNLSAACAAFELLGHELPDDYLHRLNALSLPGRLQILQADPMICVDAAHNEQAAEFLAAWLHRYMKPTREAGGEAGAGRRGDIRAVFACFADKAIEELLAPMLPLVNHWCLFPLQGPRAASVARLEQALGTALAQAASQSHTAAIEMPRIEGHCSLSNALESATKGLQSGDCVIAFGSFQVVEAMLLGWHNSNNNSHAS
ncbi:bifunctional folylpolyglutamate synthase/dihydrofolate synthase [Allohahella marinimesophila]|uniref:Dihydrofolate synthase/folylpolyglutamate synthase n=1 Tax=Allohahella marinimesophila TaxID=1054972 RepID=A0ABP7NVV4_9GAMM